jgi:hypothetical protein
MGSH